MNVNSVNIKNQNLYNQNYNKQKNNISFKNGQLMSTVFMTINKHDIIGTSLIDLMSMVIPRSIIDFTRNKEAGTETAIRESSSTLTHASIGLGGLGAAALLELGLKKRNYGVDFKAVTANEETVDAMANLFKKVVTENPTASKKDLIKTFLNGVFDDVKGLGGNVASKDKNVWFSLKNTEQNIGGNIINTQKSIINMLLEQQQSSKYKLPENILSKMMVFMNIDMPSTQELNVNLAGKQIKTTGEQFLSDVHSLTKAFTQDNVLASFKNAKTSTSCQFVKDLKKLNLNKTILGLGAICAVALSMQSINRKLTQKRTGRDGFVGDPDYDKKKNKDTTKSKKDKMFIPLKALAMATMGFFIFKTIGAKNLKDLASKVQFKGNLPTINQIKLVYGSTIMGRLFAAHDKNELRESSFRDFLGYTNFLVLGSLVTKCFVNWKDKTLINYGGTKSKLDWLMNSSVKTHEEVINSALKNDVITENGVKSLKELSQNNKITKNIANKLSVLNKAKLAGMLYSCIALGIFVPLINKYMTEKNSKKNKKTENRQDLSFASANNQNDAKRQEIINKFLTKIA